MAGAGQTAPRRCHHCAGPLSKDMETSSWTIAPLIRDSFSMIGSAIGGTASAFYGFNHAMPIVRKYIKGPMWLHFLVGAPPVIVFSSACAGLAGEVLKPELYVMLVFIALLPNILPLFGIGAYFYLRWHCAGSCAAGFFIISCCPFIALFGTVGFAR